MILLMAGHDAHESTHLVRGGFEAGLVSVDEATPAKMQLLKPVEAGSHIDDGEMCPARERLANRF